MTLLDYGQDPETAIPVMYVLVGNNRMINYLQYMACLDNQIPLNAVKGYFPLKQV